ncbi:YjdF family protein [Ruminococcaceae bacterium OttesenSCG-928-A16]|nr:YjdF family protein [Ruminococcaceae bacterium OttesenSCG-928-A16]
MQKNESRFTVFFDDPFWVGVYERVAGNKLQVCKVIFGAEPKDYEVLEFLLQNWHNLQFGPPVSANTTKKASKNPKRMQRAIKKQLNVTGVGTKSQQALKLQQQEKKVLRKQKSRQQKENEQQRQFALRQQKKKEKHRGK